MSFLIVGTGRSGTRWVSEALNATGIPTGHEAVWSVHGIGPWGDYAGDAGWTALPHLAMGAPPPGPVVHVTRHPCRVLASWYEVGLSPERDDPLLEPWRPDLIQPMDVDTTWSPEQRFEWVCAFYCALIDVAQEHAGLTLKLEELHLYETARVLVDAIGYEDFGGRLSAFWELRRDVNHQPTWHRERWWVPTGIFPWAMLPDAVTKRATDLGYGDPFDGNDTWVMIRRTML